MSKRVAAYMHRKSIVWSDDHSKAFDVVEREFVSAVKAVRPLSFRVALSLMPQDTSPGYPLNRFGYTEKRQCGALLRRMNDMKRTFQRGKFPLTFPCIAGVRNQLCKFPDNKPRLTWVYPMEMAWLESIFALPLFEAIKSGSTFIAWDINWFNGGANFLYSNIGLGTALFGFVVAGYDASVLSPFIKRSFTILKKRLILEPWQSKAWDFVVKYFIDKWLVCYKYGIHTDNGVPSGSFFTQVIDSIVNAAAHYDAVTYVAARRCSVVSDSFYSIIRFARFMGDDSLVSLRIPLQVDDNKLFSSVWLNRWNLVSHPEKGFFHPCFDPDEHEGENMPIDFLGKDVRSPMDVVISRDLLIAQLSIPDAPDSSPSDYLTRIIGLAWAKGTDREQHRILEDEFLRWQRVGFSPAPLRKGEIRSLFEYVFHSDFPALEFPSHVTIAYRYSGGRA